MSQPVSGGEWVNVSLPAKEADAALLALLADGLVATDGKDGWWLTEKGRRVAEAGIGSTAQAQEEPECIGLA